MARFEVHAGENTGTGLGDTFVLTKSVGYFAIHGGQDFPGAAFVADVAYMPDQFDMTAVRYLTFFGRTGDEPFEMSSNANSIDLSQTEGISFITVRGTGMTIKGGTETILDIEATSGTFKFDMESGNATSNFVSPQINPYGVVSSDYDIYAPKNLNGNFTNIKGIGTGDSDDTIQGSSRNDFAELGKGHNYFDGRGGIDTLFLQGTREQYTIEKTASGIIVKGPDGLVTETVNVERFGFLGSDDEGFEAKNGTLAFDSEGSAGQAYRIYQAAFDRTPDAAGLSYWVKSMDTGTSLGSVADGFIKSAEFQSIYGADSTNTAFISKLYDNVLGRAGEASGIEYWTHQLESGSTRAEVLAGFAESAENVMGVSAAIANGIWYA